MQRIEQLYRWHIDDARRLALLLCGEPALAEDLAHDAFVNCCARSVRLRDPERFRSYLLRAVARANIDRFRSERSRSGRERFVAVAEEQVHDAPASVALRLDVMTALDELPAEQRVVVVLRFWLGLPVDDIAAVLDVPTGTVKSRLSRALDRLEVLLRDG